MVLCLSDMGCIHSLDNISLDNISLDFISLDYIWSVRQEGGIAA